VIELLKSSDAGVKRFTRQSAVAWSMKYQDTNLFQQGDVQSCRAIHKKPLLVVEMNGAASIYSFQCAEDQKLSSDFPGNINPNARILQA